MNKNRYFACALPLVITARRGIRPSKSALAIHKNGQSVRPFLSEACDHKSLRSRHKQQIHDGSAVFISVVVGQKSKTICVDHAHVGALFGALFQPQRQRTVAPLEAERKGCSRLCLPFQPNSFLILTVLSASARPPFLV